MVFKIVAASCFALVLGCALTAQDLGSARASNAVAGLAKAKQSAARGLAAEVESFDSAKDEFIIQLKASLRQELGVVELAMGRKKKCVAVLEDSRAKGRLTGDQHDKIGKCISILKGEILVDAAWQKDMKDMADRSGVTGAASSAEPLFNPSDEPAPSSWSFKLPSQAQKATDILRREITRDRRSLAASRRNYRKILKLFRVAKFRLAKKSFDMLGDMIKHTKKCIEVLEKCRLARGTAATHAKLKDLVDQLSVEIRVDEAERKRLALEIASFNETKGRAIELLGSIDLELDTVDRRDTSWSWADKALGAKSKDLRSRGSLTPGRGSRHRIMVPYQPPVEYDYELTFVPEDAACDVGQMFVVDGKLTMWMLQGSRGNAGFQYVDKVHVGLNRTRTRDFKLIMGRPNTSMIKVRKSGVRAFLNGKLLAEFHDIKALSLPPVWTYNKNVLGFGANHPVRFVGIRVWEITGSGKRLR